MKRKKIKKSKKQEEKEDLRMNHQITMKLVQVVIDRLRADSDLVQTAILNLSKVITEDQKG